MDSDVYEFGSPEAFDAYAEALRVHLEALDDARRTRKLRVRAAGTLEAKIALEREYAEMERLILADRPRPQDFEPAEAR